MFDIIINKKSGTAERLGIPFIQDKIDETLNGRVRNTHFLDPDDIPSCLEHYKDSDHQILVGGGDGTITTAARLLQPYNKPFGILPLGTMNLLANDLDIAPEFTEALAQYRKYHSAWIDTGNVNDTLFLCNATLGFVPEAAKAREKARRKHSFQSWSDFIRVCAAGFRPERRQSVVLKWDGHEERKSTNTLIISNNTYVKKPAHAKDRLRRRSLTDGRLSVYTAKTSSVFESTRLFAGLMTGKWQNDPTIDAFETKDIDVVLPQKKILLTLDGEIKEMEGPLHFSIESKALPLLVPTGRYW